MWEAKVLVAQSCSTLGDPMDCSRARHPCPRNSPGKNAGVVGSHPLLQGIFPRWGWNLGLLHCRWILYHVSSPWKQTYFHAWKPSAWPTLSPSVTPRCPLVSSAEFSVMKRKRGRPKGSTKKPSPEEELAERSALPGVDGVRAPEEGSSLECSKCCRKFSNPRQLRKHICIIVLNLGEAEGDAGKSAPRQGAPTARTPSF